jgi:hypothetical protein
VQLPHESYRSHVLHTLDTGKGHRRTIARDLDSGELRTSEASTKMLLTSHIRVTLRIRPSATMGLVRCAGSTAEDALASLHKELVGE